VCARTPKYHSASPVERLLAALPREWNTPRPRPGRPFSNASRRWAGWHKAIAGPAGRQAPPQVHSQARSRGELPPAAQPARWPRASAPHRSAGGLARLACPWHAAPSCRARRASPRPDSAPEGRATPAPNRPSPEPRTPSPNPPARFRTTAKSACARIFRPFFGPAMNGYSKLRSVAAWTNGSKSSLIV
jgi:hypothetical protein